MKPEFDQLARPAAIAGLLLSALAGCNHSSERELADSEGRRFWAKCERNGECTLSQTAGSKRTGDKTALGFTRTGRLVGICDVLPGMGPIAPLTAVRSCVGATAIARPLMASKTASV